MNIAALVSGGVDSSLVVHMLRQQGLKPDLYYIRIAPTDDPDMQLDCPAEEDIELVTHLARQYGCRHEVIDLHRAYWDNVVTYIVDSAKRGLTPNPDIMCNKLIKFGAFEQQVGCHYDKTATGHYATTTVVDGHTFLSTAVDPVKDQTDFLSQLDPHQVAKLMFPIGHLTKMQVRTLAQEANLPSAGRKDSQGICFLGKTNYNDLLRHYLGEREGAIVELESGRILGTHRGYWFHTIGQRKGLLLSGGPWFVVKKDIAENILYVSQGYNPPAQYGKSIPLGELHYLTLPLWKQRLQENETIEIRFKIRHTPTFTRGMLKKTGADNYTIESDDPIQGIAPGQYATLYDEAARLVIASAQINEPTIKQ